MSNRLDNEKKFTLPDGFYKIASVVIFALIVFFFIMAIESFGKSSIEKEQEALENAIERDIVQCYSIEGAYPENLEYMEQHYGLTWDKDIFFVDYQPIAENLYPDYTVIKR
ncbi:MAG: hypothetical protein K6E91_11270 [Butyrivibrio sp.]|nr:hypothetical protein [Butyrivibrio sp.]